MAGWEAAPAGEEYLSTLPGGRNRPVRTAYWEASCGHAASLRCLWSAAQFHGSSSSIFLNRMLSDAGEHVGEPGLRIDIVQLAADDEGVHPSGSLAAAVGSGEEP